MKWFKHMSCSHFDEKLAGFLSECGLEGYGFWWLLMEVVAAQCVDDKCSATYTLPHWSRILYSHHHRVSKYMGKLGVTGIVTLEYAGSNLTVTIPNLLKYRDEYSKKSRHNQESVRPKKEIQIKKQRKKKIKEQEPLKTKDSIVYPEWLPLETWGKFLKKRVEIKKPLDEDSFQYAFKKLDKLRMAGQDPQEVLEQSCFYGWQGLFEIRDDFRKQQPTRPITFQEQASINRKQAMVDFVMGGEEDGRLEGKQDQICHIVR